MRRVAMLLTLALAASAAGCGGGGDKPLSKSDYIKKADAICARDNKKLQAAGAKLAGGQRPTAAEMSKFVSDDLVPTLSKQIDELRKLKAPKKDQDHLNSLYDEVDQGLGKVKADPTLITKGDPFAHANAGAKAYGLKVCGS